MKLPVEVNEQSQEPIYHQIEEQIKALIVSGSIPAGTALPSIRALAADLGCSVITTRRAYQNLEQHGYIKTQRGKGTFVQEVDVNERDSMKEKTVTEALQRAIRTANQHDYTEEELRKLFERVLREETTDA
ncbi:transcriptional regulator, GntR family [Geomicrobium sp. JCM 19037]|uniref:GntR family transcriptional regulator n=1 Tax=unclassified Geomicrobium TaxID=2628951 RepID=UPI00045F484A|nr:GntR family transcriptional regulator [Geomicrobium sp. JCM 19037]GAK05354.1 transcriptional regulator, GntR family [Geomicrobium sp. JCM 19037]